MATKIYRPGRAALFNADIQMGQFPNELWIALCEEGSSFMDEDPATMDALSNLARPVGSGYIDQNLAAASIFQDPDNDRVYVPSTSMIPTFNLEPGDGPIVGAVVYWKVTDDTDSIPMYGFELGVPHQVKQAESYIFPLPENGLCEIPNFGEKAYLPGRAILLEGYKQFTTGFKLKLVKQGSTYLSGNPANLAAITSLEEFGGAGYAEQDITFTINTDSDRDRVYIDCPDASFGSLDDDDAPIVGGVIYAPASINGVTNRVFYGLRLPQPTNPSGESFTFPFPTDGIAYL